MKTKVFLTLAVLVGLLAFAGTSQAGWGGGGWNRGCGWGGGGGWNRGYGWGGGGGWNRGCGWGGGGYGWGGPTINLGFWNPAPIYAAPVYAAPVYAYPVAPRVVYQSQPVYYRTKATYVDGSLVRIQVRLSKLGYYQGPLDGNFGPMTSRALREYQIDYGLPLTGRVDQRTIVSLGV
ncbi:MAG: peptidoglycan-binding domain-containing protein [Chthoniobacterales bacterium]